MYVPVKQQLLGIDREMKIYDSMYGAQPESNPLEFWKRNEKVSRRILI
jgi:hypothetical protein